MNAPESTLFNAVPVVSELNRVAGFDPLKFLKKTARGHELELRYKKLWFRLKYPAGRTRLTPLRITDQLAIIEAKVFFDKDDADPASSYIATMTQENAPAGLYIQAAEHDALDMALTNAGFGIQFAPMPKADTPYAEPAAPIMQTEPTRRSIFWIGYTVLTPSALSIDSRMRVAPLVFVSVNTVSFLH